MNKTTEQLANAAWDSMEAFILSNDFGSEYFGVDPDLRTKWREGKLVSGEVSRNLRCDWSLEENYDSPETISNVVIQHFKTDWLELLEDGDESIVNDALLKTMDGVKKRGKDPVDVQIIFGSLYREYRKNRSCYDYTLFIRPYVKWD